MNGMQQCFYLTILVALEDAHAEPCRWCDTLFTLSSPAALFPKETEEVWHERQHPHKLLQAHHQELADRLHHGLIWELVCPQLQITTESGGRGTEHNCQQAPGHSGHLSPAVLAEGTQRHHQGPQPPSTQTVLLTTVWQTIQEHGCTYHQT